MTHLDSDSYVIHSTRPREPSEFSEIRICLRFRVYDLKTFARAHVGAMKNRGGGGGKEKRSLIYSKLQFASVGVELSRLSGVSRLRSNYENV